MKIPRMALEYAVIFVVPASILYFSLSDQKEQTEAMLQKRPEVIRAKQQQEKIVNLIIDTNNEKKEEILSELFKKGSN